MATSKKPSVPVKGAVKIPAGVKRAKLTPTEIEGAKAAVKSVLAAPAKKAAEKPAFKAPKTLAAAADKVYELREERLGYSRQADAIKAEEGFLREHLIENIPKGDATGVVGKVVRVVIKSDVVPVAEDWSKIYEHIVADYLAHKKKKTGQHDGAFALLNKALNGASVKEQWESGKAVPGVGKFNSKSLSINKL
jgi:hypothetical protein